MCPTVQDSSKRLGCQLSVQCFRVINVDRILCPYHGIIVEMLRCYAFTQSAFDRFILEKVRHQVQRSIDEAKTV